MNAANTTDGAEDPQLRVEYPRAAPDMPWQGVVERLGWGGQGVGRLEDGRIVLLDSQLALFPGEEVTAAVALKARHGEGRVLDWTARDPRRVEPACPYALHCGGCDLWGAGEHAAELKRQMVADLFHRSLPVALDWQWLPAPAGTLRQRIQLHWDGKQLGYHKRQSNTIVPVAQCPVAHERLAQTIPLLARALASGALPPEPMRWELATGTPAREVVAVQSPVGLPLATAAWAAWGPDGNEPRTGRGNAPALAHKLPCGTLRHSAGGFFQVCPSWAAQAFGGLFEAWGLTGRKLYDLYGGVGFHSALLQRSFERLAIVESDSLALHYAALNLPAAKLSRHSLPVERWLVESGVRVKLSLDDVLLADPPRAGLAPQVCSALSGLRAKALVLCGCDGANFCRDVKRLAPAWRLERLAAVDLFPNTAQVECVGLLRCDSEA